VVTAAFQGFRMTLGAVLLVSSIPTTVAGVGTRRWHVALRAGIESVGAILLVLPRTVRAGGMILLVTLVVVWLLGRRYNQLRNTGWAIAGTRPAAFERARHLAFRAERVGIGLPLNGDLSRTPSGSAPPTERATPLVG
jgi:uncharacterized membrane protein YphA (DoxX/SURF4 family)